jgi:hypothetical protein
VCKAAGKPLPPFSDDDVIDYLVTEAIVAKSWKEDEDRQKAQKLEEWKRGKVGSGLASK